MISQVLHDGRPVGGLVVRPASKLPAQLADELRRHKSENIRLLTENAVMVPSVAPVPSVALCQEWVAVPPYNPELVALKPTPMPA